MKKEILLTKEELHKAILTNIVDGELVAIEELTHAQGSLKVSLADAAITSSDLLETVAAEHNLELDNMKVESCEMTADGGMGIILIATK